MNINELSTSKNTLGSGEWFRGTVWMEQLGIVPTPSPTKVIRVTFAPGARTAWHTHPLGQVLHIVDGIARIGREGEPVRELHPGDSVQFEPGERHWHGAGPNRLMSHIAVQAIDQEVGTETQWQEQVDDAAYGGS